MNLTRRFLLKLLALLPLSRGPASLLRAAETNSAQPFGAEFPKLDSLAAGEWWKAVPAKQNPPPPMDVPRDQVVAFALYTQQNRVLKMTAQLYPLKPGEAREARLEVQRAGAWTEIAKAAVLYPGWDAHFRVENWDASKDVLYRVRHGEQAMFDGLIRRDPVDQDVIVVANMSCNSSRTTGQRPEIIDNLKAQNPDLLFFAGDQTYRHTEHTAGWIEFGLQFRELLRDRPTVSIPDDHDVGHPNLWGENGKRSRRNDNSDGGSFFPVEHVEADDKRHRRISKKQRRARRSRRGNAGRDDAPGAFPAVLPEPSDAVRVCPKPCHPPPACERSFAGKTEAPSALRGQASAKVCREIQGARAGALRRRCGQSARQWQDAGRHASPGHAA